MAGVPLDKQLDGYWRMADDLGSGRFAARTLHPVGLKLKEVAVSEYRSATGRRGMRIGRNRRLARAGARYTVKSKGNLRLQMTPPGIWGLVENGAERHIINGRRGAKKVLRIGPPRRMAYSPVNHPGSPPLGSPIAATVQQVPTVWMTEQTKMVGKYL